MRYPILLALLPMLLAGCEKKAVIEVRDGNESISIGAGSSGAAAVADDGNHVAIKAPGFSANIAIPGLKFSPSDMNIDGMKLAPGTTMNGVDVNANDAAGDKHGEVAMGFTSGQAPGAIVAWYRDQATKNGFRITGGDAASTLTAEKSEDGKQSTFALSVRPQGTGSAGRFVVGGN